MSTIIRDSFASHGGIAAVDEQVAACHERRGVAGQVDGGAGDLDGQAQPAAPYIRTSRPPKRCTVAATAPRQLAPSVTSRCTGSAWPPPASTSAAVVFAPGSSTSAHATLAPAAAKASAVARPIPFAAPTTMATFFSSVNPESIITSSMRSQALPPALGPALQCTIRA